jgi:hypothetical protein
MVRRLAIAFVLSCMAAAPAWAQAQPTPGTAATQTGTTPTKPAVKKTATKPKAAAKPSVPAETGPCGIGVIPAVGDLFVVQKVGLMVFGNAEAEVPVNGWGLDELVVARVRAAAPGIGVRRVAYTAQAFEAYEKPEFKLFRNRNDDLAAVVRQITANVSCERYVVVTKYTGKLDGTNQTLHGIGILNHGTSLLSHTSLFANLQVRVFDGHSFAIRKSPFANLGSILAGTLAGMTQDPLTKLDNESFPEPATAAGNNAMLRDRTRALLAARLDKVLPAFLKEEE